MANLTASLTADAVLQPAIQSTMQPSSVLKQTTWASIQADPALKDRQDKIVKILHSQMMDFNVYNPLKLEICVKKLIQYFHNILQNPNEQKYRKASLLYSTLR